MRTQPQAFHLVFLDESHDLITKSFESREALDEYVDHFEDYFDDEVESEDDFWRFGYMPQHVIFHGALESRHV